MKRMICSLAVGGLLLLAVAPLRAADDSDADITAAQGALESARTHLKAAAHDYKGHRAKALELVEQALREAKAATAVSDKRDEAAAKKQERQDAKAATPAAKKK
ncbi:MAG: hypothetical protein HY216_10680 [Candidatus Rokubacteria bacterium]|nr:hypothetical protein [Candidatus Rokubacteria bacterium]